MVDAKAVPSLLRTLNERTVFDLIRAEAPISRAEVARRTGISKPTVSLALRTLEDAGLVRETGAAPGAPHYGAVYYEAHPEAALVLAVDLGARFLRAAVCDLAGDVRAREDVPTPAGIDASLAAIATLGESLVRTTGLPSRLLAQAVVGVPGVVPASGGRLALAGDVPGLADVDLHERLDSALAVPVTLENDVNLAALGEQWRGAARGVDDFAFLSIGTGLGAAVVLGGQLHRGANGAAGELDAIRSGRPDEIDPCAAALSAYAATTTSLPHPDDVRAIFEAARTGDAQGQRVVGEAARRIALHIVPLAASLDVPLVVLGGGIGTNSELLDDVRPLLAQWLPYPPRVEISSLGENAVLMGAVAIGLHSALDTVFLGRRG